MLVEAMLDRALGERELPRRKRSPGDHPRRHRGQRHAGAVWHPMRFLPGAISGRLAGDKPPAPVKVMAGVWLCIVLAIGLAYWVVRRTKAGSRSTRRRAAAEASPAGLRAGRCDRAEPQEHRGGRAWSTRYDGTW